MEQIMPFYVGQEVEAIKNHSNLMFKKGDKFVVTGVVKSPCCNVFKITIGVIGTGFMNCLICNTRYGPTRSRECEFDYKAFRAITSQFQSITYSEVLETELSSVN